MYEQILVPLDGSHFAEAALEQAAQLATRLKSRVILFNAITPLDEIIRDVLPWGSLDPEADKVPVGVPRQRFEAERTAAEAYFAPIKARLQGQGLDVETRIEEGQPAEAILRLADAEKASLIVMSTHGRGGLARLRFGSVADEVLRRSRVPVVVVRSVPEAGEKHG